MSRSKLKVDWCSYHAARHAAKWWHYAHSLPCSKTARLGVWEDDKFIGAVVFAWGANRHMAGEYQLKPTDCVELCRVALREHDNPVSRIVSISVKMLKRAMPGIRLIVSYADPEHGHVGAIYQAANWIYVGEQEAESNIRIKGKVVHRRTLGSKYGTSSIVWLRKHVDPNACRIREKPKHKYLFPLDAEIRKQILPLAKPYPKRAASETGLDTSEVHSEKRGSTPTAALQAQMEKGVVPWYI